MHILVTGAAGFIGFHICLSLLKQGHSVVGMDNLNEYYSVKLKRDRLELLAAFTNFSFLAMDVSDSEAIFRTFEEEQFSHVIHLAAQAGVRYSLENPFAYVSSNLTGFVNILEACRRSRPKHLVYASSSSVYGLNKKQPFSEVDCVDHPASLYAATKKSNEVLAHSYSHLFSLPVTGLRFFTVYGPWGRPDMALYIFTKALFEEQPIPLFNRGNMRRDFTYIDDIVQGICGVLPCAPLPDPSWDALHSVPSKSSAPFVLYNIGNNTPVSIQYLVSLLEKETGKKAIISLQPMQPGDVEETYADIDALHKAVGFSPRTSLEEGVHKFVSWYREYYSVES